MAYSDELLDRADAAAAAVPAFWTRLSRDSDGEGMFEVGWDEDPTSNPEGTVLLRTSTRAEASRIRERLEGRAVAAAILLAVGFRE